MTRHTTSAGLRLKSNSKANSLDQFRLSYLGPIHSIWSKLPQTLITEGQTIGWNKIKKRAKMFLTGKWSTSSTHAKAAPMKQKPNTHTYNTKLNNELNKQEDWNAIHEELKNQDISFNHLVNLLK